MLIDIHGHTAPADLLPPADWRFITPEELLARHHVAGIGQAVLLPCVSPEAEFGPIPTEEILRICDAHPGRFVPFCNVDPRFAGNTAGADLGRALDYYQERGCRGVGEVTANLWFDDPRVFNLFRACESRRLPLTFHIAVREGNIYGLIDELGLPRLERALQTFPDLVFLAHSQAFWSHLSGDVTAENWGGYPSGPVTEGGRVVELMERYPNLHGDLSAGSGHNAVARDPEFGYWFLDRFADRLHFGTDICAPTTPTPLVDFLNEALTGGHITRACYEQVGWLNTQVLLGN